MGEASTADGTLHVVPPSARTAAVPHGVYLAAAAAELRAYAATYRCVPPSAADVDWQATDVGLRAAVEATWRAALNHLAESARAVAAMRSSADLDARLAELSAQAPGSPPA